MREDQFIDVVQTSGIIVIAAVLVYVTLRLERALSASADKLRDALTAQRTLQEGVERVRAQVQTVEAFVLERNEILPASRIKTTLDDIDRRIAKLEKREGT